MTFIVDLHTHTRIGSSDSRIEAADMLALARTAPGIHGIALTEHLQRWPQDAFEALSATTFAVNARECDTRYGHVIVIGVPDRTLTAVSTVEALRQEVLRRDGLMILAHPFRHYPSSWNLLFRSSRDHWGPRELADWPPERLGEHPIFGLVDAIEVLNGGCTPAQNALAGRVAKTLGLPAVGASDAHDSSDVGWFATAFEDTIANEAELVEAIRRGRCRPVERTRDGSYQPRSTAAIP
jgi:hypothetical protein